MSRENRVGRDQRPPAARFAEIEAALDARVLAALAAAWKMAIDRQLVAGVYLTRADVVENAATLAEPISDALAADVIAGLNDRPAGDRSEAAALDGEALDHIWGVIA